MQPVGLHPLVISGPLIHDRPLPTAMNDPAMPDVPHVTLRDWLFPP